MKIMNEEIDRVHNLNELNQYCVKLLNALRDENPVIILLKGDLGAGKTKIVETLLRLIGVENVSSPTFAIHQHYQAGDLSIEHFDLYRIESDAELESTGFWDVFAQSHSWVIVEWADRLNVAELPSHWLRVEIEIKFSSQDKSQTRVITTKFMRHDSVK